MKKRVLITGGAGFIGHHTANELVKEGHFVRVLDNLDPQIHRNSPHFVENLSSEVELVTGDVRRIENVKNALSGIDAVLHLAAQTGVGQSMYELGNYIDTNVTGTAVLWEAIIKNHKKVEKVILSSSRAVYGEGAHNCENCGIVTPQQRSVQQLSLHEWETRCPRCSQITQPVETPETNALAPVSIYGLSKKIQEEICIFESRSHGIPLVILRYFNVYGQGQSLSNPYTGIAAIFSTRLLAGKNIEIYEDGKMIRDFINIKDVVRANILALETNASDILIVNVGSGEPLTVLDLAEMLRQKINSSAELIFTQRFRKGDIRACYADSTKVHEEFAVSPTVKLAKGIDELVKWVKSQKVTDLYDESVAEMKIHGILQQ